MSIAEHNCSFLFPVLNRYTCKDHYRFSDGSQSKTVQCKKIPGTPPTEDRYEWEPLNDLCEGRCMNARARLSATKLTFYRMFNGRLNRSSESVGYRIRNAFSRADILFLKHASSIFRQPSNPVCGSWKSPASSLWAKQHRA